MRKFLLIIPLVFFACGGESKCPEGQEQISILVGMVPVGQMQVPIYDIRCI